MRLTFPIALLIAVPAFAQIAGPTLDGAPAAAPAPPPADNPYLRDETRADAEARAAQVFAAMDLDHDGFVTADEATAFILAHRPDAKKPGAAAAVAETAKAMIADADTDKDGRVSAEESKAAADRGFDAADTNHDGVVTPEERAAAMRDDDGAAPTKIVKGKPADSPR